MTKYVYGHGLIGEEKQDLPFKVYHFDYRGSTAAITDVTGYVTDRFEYDTYGRQTEHTGSSFVIFGYNGRDGVVTDNNGLIYMRARYYKPELRRFINADVLHGEIADSTSLNRYAYVNGNPISFVDSLGLSPDRSQYNLSSYTATANNNSEILFEDDILLCAYPGLIVYNPWWELYHNGQIHNAVVRYLASEYGYKAEKVSANKLHRYDLYSEASGEYWEVKPISYLSNPVKRGLLELQMAAYNADGVDPGDPLGYHEMEYWQYTVKIYSYEEGAIFYTFQREKEPANNTIPSIIPKRETETKIDRESVGQTLSDIAPIIGVVIMIGILATTGMLVPVF